MGRERLADGGARGAHVPAAPRRQDRDRVGSWNGEAVDLVVVWVAGQHAAVSRDDRVARAVGPELAGSVPTAAEAREPGPVGGELLDSAESRVRDVDIAGRVGA